MRRMCGSLRAPHLPQDNKALDEAGALSVVQEALLIQGTVLVIQLLSKALQNIHT